MRKVVLLYNPASGRHRVDQVRAAAAVFRKAGVDAEAVATRGPGAAGEQAREAIAARCDTVFACGGDGTVHDALQGMIGSDAALGVIPLGTANALAADLGLPRNAVRAAEAALESEARGVAAGRIEYNSTAGPASRYFIVTAGVGPDAYLMYIADAALKRRFGMSAYYAQATWVWATHGYPKFQVEFCDCETGANRQEIVTQVLAVRVAVYGGLLHSIAPGASLARDDFRLVLFKTASRIRYLGYVLRCMARSLWQVPGVELVHAREIVCRPLGEAGSQARVFAEADGELLGTMPARIVSVPNAVRLLIPRTYVANAPARASIVG